MDKKFETGEVEATQQAAVGAETTSEFDHTGTDIGDEYQGGFTGAPESVAPATEVTLLVHPHYREPGYGVQVPDVARNDRGWRTYEEAI